jgi:hypothetical protein
VRDRLADWAAIAAVIIFIAIVVTWLYDTPQMIEVHSHPIHLQH